MISLSLHLALLGCKYNYSFIFFTFCAADCFCCCCCCCHLLGCSRYYTYIYFEYVFFVFSSDFFLIASYTSCALCRKSTIRCEIHWTSHCMCNTHCVCLYLFRWLPVHNDEAICLQSTYVCVRFFFGVYLFNCFLWKYVKFIEEKKNRNKFEYTTGKSKQSTATIPTHTIKQTQTPKNSLRSGVC